MKKFFLMLLVCAASLVGCKNAKEAEQPFDKDAEMLVGQWELTEWRTSEESDYQAWTQEATKVTLSSDEKFATEGYLGKETGRYKRNGKYIYFYYGDSTQPAAMFIIDSLSKNELVVIFDFTYYLKFKRL